MDAHFNAQPVLGNGLVQVRPLRAEDLEALYAAASAPETWAGHPASDRYQRDVFLPYAQTLLASGTALVVIEAESGRIIGTSSYYAAPEQPDSIAIGFTFLAHTHWGGATNFALKRLMLDHALAHVAEVWFHIAPTNLRSQWATAKLGAEAVMEAVLTISGEPKTWLCFRLRRETWQEVCRVREGD